MLEAFTEIFTSGEIWSIVIKVLVTAAAGGIITLCGTLLSKVISRNKESKIYRYAKTLVEAAEQKFPNEGTKMGPQKMDYVMSQIVIRFPGVKDNRYLYNIVEQAVYKLNEEKQKQKLIEEFEAKYGEGSYVEDMKDVETSTEQEEVKKEEETIQKSPEKESDAVVQKQTAVEIKKNGGGLKSF